MKEIFFCYGFFSKMKYRIKYISFILRHSLNLLLRVAIHKMQKYLSQGQIESDFEEFLLPFPFSEIIINLFQFHY